MKPRDPVQAWDELIADWQETGKVRIVAAGDNLKAELLRLREALETVAEWDANVAVKSGYTGVREFARAALVPPNTQLPEDDDVHRIHMRAELGHREHMNNDPLVPPNTEETGPPR